jgi:cytochrome d ubiquinol oxidase subunit II
MIIAVLIILLVALTLYTVLGGADFGAGVWEVNTAFKANERERNLLYHAIGPVWETNHVWLIFVMVILFGAFPPAFASLNQALFVPLLLALVGIVFRGAAYAFRSQLKGDPNRSQQTRRWVAVFGFASVLAPLFLGASVGAIASGQLAFDVEGNYQGNYLTGWINSLSVFIGFFTVGLCAYCTATYMIREAHQNENSPSTGTTNLVELWRRRALLTGIGMGVLAMFGLALVATSYPELWQGLLQRGWPLILISIVAGSYSLWAIHGRIINGAVVGVSLTCASVVLGWGCAQYPDILPGVWSAEQAASPTSVLRIILISILVGAVFLIPALFLLFRIFKSDSPASGNSAPLEPTRD